MPPSNRRISWSPVLTGLLLAALAAPVRAEGEVGDFNFNETTGLINIPVAKVVPAGGAQLFINSVATGGKPTPVGIDIDEFFANDGSIGVRGGLPGNVEVSAMALHGGVFKNNTWVFGVKWLALPDGPDHPAFAIGVQSLNNHPQASNPHPASFDTPSAFGVMSHSFPLNDSGAALDLHAGIGTGRLKNGFAGAEFHVAPEFSVLGEYDGTVESAGFRFSPSRRFDILTIAQFQSTETFFGFQFSYKFGPLENDDPVDESLNPEPTPSEETRGQVVTPDLSPATSEPDSQVLEPAPSVAAQPSSQALSATRSNLVVSPERAEQAVRRQPVEELPMRNPGGELPMKQSQRNRVIDMPMQRVDGR